MADHSSNIQNEIIQEEHQHNLHAKRVVGIDETGASVDGPYATRIDDTTTANTTYIGKAPIGSATSGAVWQIKKLDTSSGVITTWADGDASFNNVWDDRASLSYS